jgi:isocitrate dehydrogenase
MYWAQALSSQTDDAELSARFGGIAQSLADNEAAIVAELVSVQGQPMDIGGYYMPDVERATAAMRPSKTLNAIVAAL